MPNPEDSTLHSLIQRYIYKTSVQSQVQSLTRLLQHFCTSKFEIKSAVLPNGNCTNFIQITKKVKSSRNSTVVLTHGFGLGLGFYFANFDALSTEFDRVIAVDWSGMAGSSRRPNGNATWPIISPSPIPLRSAAISAMALLPPTLTSVLPFSKEVESYRANTHEERVADFFIDNLEEWRIQELGVDSKFVLVGHSLGGLLSTRYTLKYPKAVQGLVLASPVGLPAHPPTDVQLKTKELPNGVRLATSLWNLNVTPQSLLRSLGPWGPDFVSNVLVRRFGGERWSEHEKGIISSYLYHISVPPPSGEYSLNSLLIPIFYRADPQDVGNNVAKEPSQSSVSSSSSSSGGEQRGGERRTDGTSSRPFRGGVYARRPLHPLIPGLGVHGIPVLLLFGDHDWMLYPELQRDAALWRARGTDLQLRVLPSAGHHLYFDNAPAFNQAIISWTRGYKFN